MSISVTSVSIWTVVWQRALEKVSSVSSSVLRWRSWTSKTVLGLTTVFLEPAHLLIPTSSTPHSDAYLLWGSPSKARPALWVQACAELCASRDTSVMGLIKLNTCLLVSVLSFFLFFPLQDFIHFPQLDTWSIEDMNLLTSRFSNVLVTRHCEG